VALLVLIVAFAAASLLCALLLPFFRHVFLVIPNARSSHVKATPQGGGLVVIPVALIVGSLAAFAFAGAKPDAFAWGLAAALLVLMLLGGWDDRGSLNPAFRILVQAGAAGLALAAAPFDWSGLAPFLPFALVYAILWFGMVWFINLTNFMDGVDLMSVTQFAPALAAVYLLLMSSEGPAQWLGLVCLAGVGALLGFAVLNKPPARLFLGDSGSLPLGLLGASAIVAVGALHGPAVALLPFLYYIADATLTLARRILTGQKFWRAHRDHFYQQAMRRGLSPPQIVARVGLCNLALCALALIAAGRGAGLQSVAFAFGLAAVAALIGDLVRDRT
jgi:UDP-N-acetylmuramyl pentapeptide phosphotransferase/UDP-N-acetylglucosamine-1-phosphate transferase